MTFPIYLMTVLCSCELEMLADDDLWLCKLRLGDGWVGRQLKLMWQSSLFLVFLGLAPNNGDDRDDDEDDCADDDDKQEIDRNWLVDDDIIINSFYNKRDNQCNMFTLSLPNLNWAVWAE